MDLFSPPFERSLKNRSFQLHQKKILVKQSVKKRTKKSFPLSVAFRAAIIIFRIRYESAVDQYRLQQITSPATLISWRKRIAYPRSPHRARH